MTATIQVPRLLEAYEGTVRAKLMEKHSIDNVMAAPRLQKIIISMGVGEARENKALCDQAAADLTLIAGQKAAITVARMSVSNFRLREGMPIGCRVTLRGHRMWEFLDRLVTVVIPRIKDFRGLRRTFDGRGNYSMGLTDQTVFPEIDLDRVKRFQGMNITMVTNAGDDAVAFDLLEALGMPFKSAVDSAADAARRKKKKSRR
ncbi:MAG: 50S ribosomal protein L5 [Planctomycetes bacterium]|nr:50S ribosomal protein L5 [Planctomycetota bacterium]